MTFGPGRQVWERFGHNAIWVHDPVHGTDQAYNYGLFDFHQQNFLLRFVRGQMWYWMAGFPGAAVRRASTSATTDRCGCRSWSSRRARRLELQEFLAWNARARASVLPLRLLPRQLLDPRARRARPRPGRRPASADRVGPERHHLPLSHPASHRQRCARLAPACCSRSAPGVDRPITAWEEMFLPAQDAGARPAGDRRRAPTARAVPLVRSEQTLFESSDAASARDARRRGSPWYLALGAAIGGAALVSARGARASRRRAVRLPSLTGGLGLVAGLAGLVLAGLWGLTDHVMAYRNENLLQLNPLALLLLPGTRRARAGEGVGAPRRGVGLVAGGAVRAGAGAQAAAADSTRGTAPVIALALPAQLGIAAALRHLRSARRCTRCRPVAGLRVVGIRR